MGSRTRDFVGMLDATQGPSRARQSPSPADDDDHPDGVAGSDVDDDDDDDGDFAAPAASGSRQALKDKMPGVNGGVLGGARPVPPEYGQIRWPARPKAGPREQVAAVTDIYGRRKFETVGAAAADCSYWAVQWSARLYEDSRRADDTQEEAANEEGESGCQMMREQSDDADSLSCSTVSRSADSLYVQY